MGSTGLPVEAVGWNGATVASIVELETDEVSTDFGSLEMTS